MLLRKRLQCTAASELLTCQNNSGCGLLLLPRCRWDLVCRLTKRYGLANSARGPVSMQV
jgi:hypothetical protein